MARCRSCGAEIIFIKLKSGKLNPCDPARRQMIKGTGKGRLITDEGEIVSGTFASLEEGANVGGYVSHFATCPNANAHRRSR